jgi:hypothetical protein
MCFLQELSRNGAVEKTLALTPALTAIEIRNEKNF